MLADIITGLAIVTTIGVCLCVLELMSILMSRE